MTTADSSQGGDLPGLTTSGLGSASQLMAFASSVPLMADVTTAARPLFVMPSLFGPLVTPLRLEDYPVLAEIWDNDEDDVFDTI